MSLKIIKAGVLDTVQDEGRFGFGSLGINPGGAADASSAALANVLLGKEMSEPVIEMHFPAATILFTQPTIICITGADFTACIDSANIPVSTPVAVASNTVLTFRGKRKGERCYLATIHNWVLNSWLRSFSTHIKAGIGGLEGRALKANDEIIFLADIVLPKNHNPAKELPWFVQPQVADTYIGVIYGPEWRQLNQESRDCFLQEPFYIKAASDRMALLLSGIALQSSCTEIVSSPVAMGTIQLTPSGAIAILMADRQTTGGYPRIAQVGAAWLSQLAQANAGMPLHFRLVTLDDAEEKLRRQFLWLQTVQNSSAFKMKNYLSHATHA